MAAAAGKPQDGDEPTPGVVFVPECEVEAEVKIKNSVFIGTVGHTPTTEDARAFISKLKERYPDASHWCYAFAIGHGASVIHGMSDDGEPSGTAGKPILQVVGGSGLGDVCVVVTRFYGGTKLGTGGLVKAYTEGAKVALELVTFKEKVALEDFMFSVSYDTYQKCRMAVEKHGGAITSEDFVEDVTLEVSINENFADQLKAELSDITKGAVEFV
uniref:Impact N-terminal domain-containing protein n=1 Tax=Eutreptiella gymnastica TaxID=73025 RepID=A0A7S1NH10_9EUGL